MNAEVRKNSSQRSLVLQQILKYTQITTTHHYSHEWVSVLWSGKHRLD